MSHDTQALKEKTEKTKDKYKSHSKEKAMKLKSSLKPSRPSSQRFYILK